MAAFFGDALMALGALVAVLSGLCSTVFIGVSLKAAFQDGAREFLFGAGLALAFGGVPFLVGLALFFVGRVIYRVDPRQAGPFSGDGPVPPP